MAKRMFFIVVEPVGFCLDGWAAIFRIRVARRDQSPRFIGTFTAQQAESDCSRPTRVTLNGGVVLPANFLEQGLANRAGVDFCDLAD